jgi:hypothetical protein
MIRIAARRENAGSRNSGIMTAERGLLPRPKKKSRAFPPGSIEDH